METLSIKELAPYLPYGLQMVIDRKVVWRPNKDEYPKTKEADATLTPALLCDIIDGVYDSIAKFKPLLRPLSDLTKEIEVNGEKFVPYKKLGWDLSHNECGMGERLSFGDAHSGTINVLDYIEDYYFLLEWHFDIKNLIGRNLAIDLNTIKETVK